MQIEWDTPITMDDVQELFELRLILESAVARLAVSRITSAELDRLAALSDPPHVGRRMAMLSHPQ